MKTYVAELMQSRTQAHVYHLQTDSYSKHEALQDYYEDIVPLVDEIVEAYQGKYGKIMNYPEPTPIKNMQENEDILAYFDKFAKFINLKRVDLPKDGFLEHKFDEVDTLIRSTIYKLRFLK